MVDMTLTRECAQAPALSDEEFEELAAFVLEREDVDRPCMVSVTIVDDDEMRRLNSEWRGVDKPTDVLSLELERPDDPDLTPGEPCELGDIVLAPAYIEAQADRLDQPVKTETTLLFTHAMLHLLGYDHLDDEDAEVMEAREDLLVGEFLGLDDYHAATTRHRDER